MRIKELYIRRYGPLSDVHLRFEKGIQPIFGENESGKTLIVDCIIKMLSGGTRDLGQQINRVEELPEGYLIIEDDGKETKLEKGKSLADYLSIEAEEIRNIFVVREADLKIEEGFYEKVTDKITGLRSNEIERIIGKLRELGRLTESNNLSDDQHFKKPKTNKKNAEKLKEDVHNYIGDAERAGIQDLEAKYFEAKIRKGEVDKKIELLEKAKDKETFLDLKNRLGRAQEIINILNKKPDQQKLNELKSEIKNYKTKASNKTFLQKTSNLFKILTIIFSLAVTLPWLIFSLAPEPFLTAFLLISLFIFGFSSWKLSIIESIPKKLIGDAKELGINERNVEELESAVKTLENEISRLEKELNGHVGILKRELNIVEMFDDNKVMEVAKNVLRRKEAEVDLNLDMKYDSEELARAKEEQKSLEKNIENFNNLLSAHKKRLIEFSNRVQGIDFSSFMGRGLNVQIENLDSLKVLERELGAFIEKIDRDAELSRHAIEIFSEIKREEEEKIKALFGPESSTSKIFKEITEGRYNNVSYNVDENEIFVFRPNGEKFSVNKLSKGTFDQLYMSIRIDLARRILGDRKGFFVMDDAFISSGPNRFKNAVEIIKNLSDEGWNIIYFTVRRDDAEFLSKFSGNDPIVLPPLP
ncbi:MAG: AAA family ATPase [Nitrososphaeria archaeon]